MLDTPGIKGLREAGGTWKAEQLGFGYYRYHGLVGESKFEVQSYSHCTIHVSGYEEYYSVWHLKVYDKEVWCGGSWGCILEAVKAARFYWRRYE